MNRKFRIAMIAAAGLSLAPVASASEIRTILSFKDLAFWEQADHEAALDAFAQTCGAMKPATWASVCKVARSNPGGRAFFELLFRPVLVEDGTPGLLTGYFEPELFGSRIPTATYRYPVYKSPPELGGSSTWYTRAEIENEGVLAGRGLEIAWVDDPVKLFYLHVQGSGRIKLTDGSVIRLGYHSSNGRKYRSPGQELVRRGVYEPHQVSADVIGNWVRRNPDEGRALLQLSESYVFFRVIPTLSPEEGPRGAMNMAMTAGVSLAIDPRYIPLGAPVWLEKGGADPFRKLMIAQDTGSAIKGAQRGDIFVGTGDQAGREAARIRDPGRLIVLLPIDIALAMVGTGANP